MSAIDLAAMRATPLCHEPFDHLVVPGFVRAESLGAVNADFPEMSHPGSFPLSELAFGPDFAALIDELDSAETRAALEDKFDIDLSARPIMCTVRGRCRAADGRIHADSASKILTVLIYLNPAWSAEGGRLRLLRSAHDIEDYAAEITPEPGTLLAFRCTGNAWHGHKPFEGERRSIQLNWVTSRAVVWREQWRHRLSARVKRLIAAAEGGWRGPASRP
ncbi:MAG: 2OG-Fe(II) oxygenase [Kiloniellales bacterium]